MVAMLIILRGERAAHPTADIEDDAHIVARINDILKVKYKALCRHVRNDAVACVPIAFAGDVAWRRDVSNIPDKYTVEKDPGELLRR